jgi:hypothetical protein
MARIVLAVELKNLLILNYSLEVISIYYSTKLACCCLYIHDLNFKLFPASKNYLGDPGSYSLYVNTLVENNCFLPALWKIGGT